MLKRHLLIDFGFSFTYIPFFFKFIPSFFFDVIHADVCSTRLLERVYNRKVTREWLLGFPFVNHKKKEVNHHTGDLRHQHVPYTTHFGVSLLSQMRGVVLRHL